MATSGASLRAVAVALLLVSGGAARAEIPIFDGDDASFSLGGYARQLSGVQVPAIEGAGLPDSLGLSQALVRLEWKLTLGRVATVEIHDRLALTVTGSDAALAGGLGVGVTPAPKRSLDLRSVIVDEPTTILEHDLDRLVLRLFLGTVDVTVGRQAITWGTSNLFTVADAWAAFSPFDLDTSQKRGVDALRVGTPLGERLELDLVVADRGSVDDLSGGARLTAYLGDADVYFAVAKQWRELAVMGGISAAVDEVKLRGEVWWGAWDLAREEVLNPRATLGVDWFHGDLTLSVEAHYNGAGAADSDDYLTLAATSPELNRGEVFWLGRYYLGAASRYLLTPQLELSVSLLSNLGDPSLLVVTRLRYDVAENVDLGIGAFDGFGGGVDLGAGRFDSELGAYGHLVYIDLSAWF